MHLSDSISGVAGDCRQHSFLKDAIQSTAFGNQQITNYYMQWSLNKSQFELLPYSQFRAL